METIEFNTVIAENISVVEELLPIVSSYKNGLQDKRYALVDYWNGSNQTVYLYVGTLQSNKNSATIFNYYITRAASLDISDGSFILLRHSTNQYEINGRIYKKNGDASIYIEKCTGKVYVKLNSYQRVSINIVNTNISNKDYGSIFIPDMVTTIDSDEGLTLLS